MKKKIAKKSFDIEGYECKYAWDDDCSVQCGDSGVVFSKKGNYTTAFFEAFPKNPNTFIRGEGKTIEEAETRAWEQLNKYRNCKNHEFERRDYKNGVGFCKHCGLMKSKAFKPLTKCVICGNPTYYTSDIDGNYYCKKHSKDMPLDKMSDYKRKRYEYKKIKTITDEQSLNRTIDYLKKDYSSKDNFDLIIDVINTKFNNINLENEYIFVENCNMSLYMFYTEHSMNSYEEVNGFYIIKFDENENVSVDDDIDDIVKTGKTIYLISTEQDYIKSILIHKGLIKNE